MRAILLTGAVMCALAASLPLEHHRDVEFGDTDVVGSSLTVVRVAAPEGFDQQSAASGDNHGHRRSEGGDRDEVGYVRTRDTRGDHGYQAFDSFHKKGGDKYGFETHSAYGKVKDAEGGGGHQAAPSEHHEEYQDGDSREWSSGYSEGDDGKGNKYSEHYSSGDPDGGHHY